MKAAFKIVLPKTENASRQIVEQKQGFKDNQIGMVIVTMNITHPSLIVKIKIHDRRLAKGNLLQDNQNSEQEVSSKRYDVKGYAKAEINSLEIERKGSKDPDEFGTNILRLDIEYPFGVFGMYTYQFGRPKKGKNLSLFIGLNPNPVHQSKEHPQLGI